MKTIKNLNLFAIALPIVLSTLFIIDINFLILGLVSTIATGFIQLGIGLKMLFDNPKNKNLQAYITAVALFFTLCFVHSKTGYNDYFGYCLVFIPIVLAIYLTLIIYKKSES
jgi:choline-glycine betaine transporter